MFGTFVADDPALHGGKVPFDNVFLHGLIRDQFGQKMSKSKGNGIDPLDWVEMFGADALRFTLARGASPGGDLSIGEDAARASRNFTTKLFNATRFALMNGAALGELPDVAELTDADRWILGRLEQVRAEVDGALDRYEFSVACEGCITSRGTSSVTGTWNWPRCRWSTVPRAPALYSPRCWTRCCGCCIR